MNETKEYVIGLDGGGTKTHCALFDTNGNRKDFMEFGATNHESMPEGFHDLEIELYKIFDAILERNDIGVENLKHCAFGMAGVDTQNQHSIISKIIRNYGIKDFVLSNDSYLGIKAGSTNGIGICAINGTGCSITGIDTKGTMLQVGGLGALTSDKGGGTYLFERAISSVYRSLYKCAQNTYMKDVMFADLGIDSKADFLEKVIEKLQTDSKEYVKKINCLVYNAANKNDCAAINILEEVGEEYAWSIGGVLRELDFKTADKIEIILAGSNFTKCANQTSINKLEAMIKSEFKDYNTELKILKEPCVIGAVLWALQNANGTVDLRDKVISEYHKSVPVIHPT